MHEEKIYIRMSVYNEEELEESRSELIGDMVAVPYAEWAGEEEAVSGKILMECVDTMERKDILSIAWDNINRASYEIESMEVMNHDSSEKKEKSNKAMLYVLYSNEYRFSASLMFRTDILKGFAGEHNCSDILIVPVSNEKVYIYPHSGNLQEHITGLKGILDLVNRERGCSISEHIYRYDCSDGKIIMC